MTVARQERKPARSRAFFAAFSGAWVLATIGAAGFASIAVGAATTEWVVTNRYTGFVLDGLDPVAYFVDAAPKAGRAELAIRSAGATWRLLNERDRSALAAAPQVYTP